MFVNLYRLKIASLENIDFMKDSLATDELARLEKIVSEKRQKEYLASRFLLRKVFEDKYDKKNIVIKLKKSGKPYIENGHFMSWSHCFDNIVLCVSDVGEVGVDVEPVFRQNSFIDIAKKYFSEKEQESIFSEDNLASQQRKFLYIWTMKEAIYKMHSLTFNKENSKIFLNIENKTIDQLPKSICDSQFVLRSYYYDDLFLSLAIKFKEGVAISCYEVDSKCQQLNYTLIGLSPTLEIYT